MNRPLNLTHREKVMLARVEASRERQREYEQAQLRAANEDEALNSEPRLVEGWVLLPGVIAALVLIVIVSVL